MLYNVRSNNDLTNNFASYLINEYVMLWCNWPVLQASGLADCLCAGFGAGPSLATPQRTGRRRMLLVQRLQLHVQRPPHYAQPRPLAPRQTTIRRAARRPGLPHLRQVRSLLLFFSPPAQSCTQVNQARHTKLWLQRQFTLLPWCRGKIPHLLFAEPWKGVGKGMSRDSEWQWH